MSKVPPTKLEGDNLDELITKAVSEPLVCRLNAKNEKICVIFLCVEKGADKGWPLDRSQETRKIMRQSPCFTLLHALAFLADSQQFDEKIRYSSEIRSFMFQSTQIKPIYLQL